MSSVTPGLFRSLLPPQVEVEEGPLLSDEEELSQDETRIIDRAVPHRRREFASGRTYARRALARLGSPPMSLLRLDSGAPAWPEGYRGSITHGADYCAVAVARANEVAALGIDIERIGRITAGMVVHIASPGERAHILEPLDAEEKQRMLTLLFSAKESIFKSQLLPEGIGSPRFSQIELEIDLAGGRFRATQYPGAVGAFLISQGRVATAIAMPY